MKNDIPVDGVRNFTRDNGKAMSLQAFPKVLDINSYENPEVS